MWSRRRFLVTAAATITPLLPPTRTTPLIDSHVHVWKHDPAFPFAAGATSSRRRRLRRTAPRTDASQPRRPHRPHPGHPLPLGQPLPRQRPQALPTHLQRRLPSQPARPRRARPPQPPHRNRRLPRCPPQPLRHSRRRLDSRPAHATTLATMRSAQSPDDHPRAQSRACPTSSHSSSRTPTSTSSSTTWPTARSTSPTNSNCCSPSRRYPRVYVKISHMWSLSKQPYPYADAITQVKRLCDSLRSRSASCGEPTGPSRSSSSPTTRAVALYRDHLDFLARRRPRADPLKDRPASLAFWDRLVQKLAPSHFSENNLPKRKSAPARSTCAIPANLATELATC